jgi:hypothetical protein
MGKMCPIYSACDRSGKANECLADLCVWWLEDQQACAMVAAAKNTLATAIAVNSVVRKDAQHFAHVAVAEWG